MGIKQKYLLQIGTLDFMQALSTIYFDIEAEMYRICIEIRLLIALKCS